MIVDSRMSNAYAHVTSSSNVSLVPTCSALRGLLYGLGGIGSGANAGLKGVNYSVKV